MIVREQEHAFVMIEQHDHAQISGDIISKWQEQLFLGKTLRKSVEYAVYMHDYGWKEFDKQPFYNDLSNTPYTFSDFPTYPKIILYQYGIDEVVKVDPYAGLLCSEHYTRFLLDHNSDEAQQFVLKEKDRQREIKSSLDYFDQQIFDFHYSMIQLGDRLSLYLCLNEPGSPKEDVHYFFKKGVPLPVQLSKSLAPSFDISWRDSNTLLLNPFPLEGEFKVSIKQRVVSKQEIEKHGLIQAYQNTPLNEEQIIITPN